MKQWQRCLGIGLCQSCAKPDWRKGVCVLLQIDAIFRHESQKDRALFPGADPREFWQRARDRNEVCVPLWYSRAMLHPVSRPLPIQLLCVVMAWSDRWPV